MKLGKRTSIATIRETSGIFFRALAVPMPADSGGCLTEASANISAKRS